MYKPVDLEDLLGCKVRIKSGDDAIDRHWWGRIGTIVEVPASSLQWDEVYGDDFDISAQFLGCPGTTSKGEARTVALHWWMLDMVVKKIENKGEDD